MINCIAARILHQVVAAYSTTRIGVPTVRRRLATLAAPAFLVASGFTNGLMAQTAMILAVVAVAINGAAGRPGTPDPLA